MVLMEEYLSFGILQAFSKITRAQVRKLSPAVCSWFKPHHLKAILDSDATKGLRLSCAAQIPTACWEDLTIKYFIAVPIEVRPVAMTWMKPETFDEEGIKEAQRLEPPEVEDGGPTHHGG